MAKLTWLGSTEGYREGETPLDSCTWNGVLFTAGDKVEITDEWMIKKARGNRFFRVEDSNGSPRPETWTNDPPPEPPPLTEPPRYPDNPPDYPPEDEPDREPHKKRRGRPPRIRDNGNGDQ
jgi:hypothetical protein